MKKFSVDLFEEKHTFFLEYAKNKQKKFLLAKKNGLLRRQYDQDWSSQGIELNCSKDAQKIIGVPVKKISEKKLDVFYSSPGKILAEYGALFAGLEQMKLIDWKVVFRKQLISRQIFNSNNVAKANTLTLNTILIKIRPIGHIKEIEIGEGYADFSVKFNQTGLIKRISDILANQQLPVTTILVNKPVSVIVNAGDGGILFHEILGHCLEADYIYQTQSPFTVKDLGKKMVSSQVTLKTVDCNDPFFSKISCDDEGEKIVSPVLVNQGVVENFISDKFYKNLLHLSQSGHCRVEDFSKIPCPRMFSIYLMPGKFQPEDLFQSTSYGVFAKEFGEGKLVFDKNQFYFTIKESYLIENGKITAPLGKISVSGDLLTTLNSIEMVGNDFRFDKGTSYCQKNGQTLHVRVGQPSVKINNLWVSRGLYD